VLEDKVADRAQELAEEQAYFDRAWEARERHREQLRRAPSAGADKKAAAAARSFAEESLGRLRSSHEAVAFGRIDVEDGEARYIGYNAILDENKEPLVINWAAPAAAPYYLATHADSHGVERKRTYRCDGNTILDFEDVVFAALKADVERLEAEPAPAEVTDALLDELSRRRSGEMTDIVRTIQAAQYEIVRADPDRLLVVQGGPGTGKTAIGLHRAAWLLYNYRDRFKASDVLVVGPNPTFVRYIRNVLPSLGDRDVWQLDVASLVEGVRATREEDPVVSRLKGDLKIRSLIDQALQDRIRVPAGPIQISIGATAVTFTPDELDEWVRSLRTLRYAQGRQQLRELIRSKMLQQTGEGDRGGQVEALVERIWPQLSPQAFLQELLGSEARLLAAAGEEFSAPEVRSLYRRAAERLSEETWSRADIALLDYIDDRMNGAPARRFGHIIVDEAQDLSPMELLMISRRSETGSMTVLGDLAQSVGPWARDSWAPVIEALNPRLPVEVVELKYGYRVPRQIFEYAAQLLPIAAPHLTPPKVVRDGPEDPVRIQADEASLGDQTVEAALAYLARGVNVGVICPSSLMGEVTSAFAARGVEWSDPLTDGLSGPITVIPAPLARGLEFDAVVVVEPEAIVAEDAHGHRLLYTALTRSTRFLSVVHAGADLPGVGGSDSIHQEDAVDDQPGERKAVATARQERSAMALASVIAEEIRESVEPEFWGRVAERIRRLLEEELDAPSEEGLTATSASTPKDISGEEFRSVHRDFYKGIFVPAGDDVAVSIRFRPSPNEEYGYGDRWIRYGEELDYTGQGAPPNDQTFEGNRWNTGMLNAELRRSPVRVFEELDGSPRKYRDWGPFLVVRHYEEFDPAQGRKVLRFVLRRALAG
jgi:DNA helicase IV